MVSVCTTCKGLQKHLNGPATGQDSGPDGLSIVQWVDATLPTVRRAGSQGCRACALLLQGILLHHERFAGVDEDRIRISAQTYHSAGPDAAQDHLSVDIRWKGDGDQPPAHRLAQGYPDLRLEFFTDGDGQSSFTAIGQGRPITENPGQECGSQSVRNMISECLSKHAKCRQTQPTPLPKRVLDVMTNEPAKGIPLHESAQAGDGRYEQGQYLALSYCWGTGRGIPQTTLSTLASHKKGISWKSLPRTFQEAILLTRARGFRWLWIDALCIVQDDAAEKLEASLGLADIFGNAFLTIAATSAVDTAGGLYPPIAPPFKLQATDSKGSLSKIYVREQPSHYSFKAPFNEGAHMNDWELPFNMSPEANEHTPLLRRAWAYSERLLSPRVLHFTDSEMMLECREAYQCECGRIDNAAYDSRTTDSVKQEYARIVGVRATGGANNDKRIDSVASQLAATSLTAVGRDLAKKRDDALQLWSYIVTEYTARHLTLDADRLVAIAAVAGTLSRALDAGYVAGHWTCSTLGLLWYPNESSHCRRPKTNASHNVPSWSWASVEGSPIFFDNASAMDLACTASWTADGAVEDLWSPTSGDTLHLSAAMAADVTFRVDAENEYSLVHNGVSVEFCPDIVPPRGEDVLESGEQLVCVLVSMTFRSSIIGLVLKPLAADPTRHRRVGRFECYECQRDDSEEDAEDAEALFEHWFPDMRDMTTLDDGPHRNFVIV